MQNLVKPTLTSFSELGESVSCSILQQILLDRSELVIGTMSGKAAIMCHCLKTILITVSCTEKQTKNLIKQNYHNNKDITIGGLRNWFKSKFFLPPFASHRQSVKGGK